MSHVIWHEDIVLGTVDLPRGDFVASRLRPSAGYQSVAEIVQRATVAFLHVGLFYSNVSPDAQTLDASPWASAIAQVSRLRFTLTNAVGDAVATHFVNLLEVPRDSGVIVLVSRNASVSQRQAMSSRNTPPPTSVEQPAV